LTEEFTGTARPIATRFFLAGIGTGARFESVATNSGFDGLLCDDRKFRLLPGVEPSHYIDHVLKTGPLQKAAGDHAAIPSLAVNGDGKVAIDFRGRDFEVIERPP
jgi:hypothetical protein